MKYFIAIFSIVTCAAAGAQNRPDTLNAAIDSLFVRASSINVYHADMVQPSKEALGRMGVTAVPRLVEKMKTQDAREMQTLEDVFKLIGAPSVPQLVDALGSDEVYRRRLAARVLGEIKDSSSVDGLLKYSDDDDFRMRAGVISALGKVGQSRAIPKMREALVDKDYLVRTSAAIALANFKDSTNVIPLIRALSDAYYGVRYSAAAALSNIGKPAIRPVFDALRVPGDTLAFYLLIEVAGNIADKKFLEPLLKIINSDDPYARAFAAEALGRLGTEESLKALQDRYEIETHPLVISKIEAVVLN